MCPPRPAVGRFWSMHVFKGPGEPSEHLFWVLMGKWSMKIFPCQITITAASFRDHWEMMEKWLSLAAQMIIGHDDNHLTAGSLMLPLLVEHLWHFSILGSCCCSYCWSSHHDDLLKALESSPPSFLKSINGCPDCKGHFVSSLSTDSVLAA